MTLSYTFQYRFFSKQWSAPAPPESENIQKTLEFRLLVAPYLKNSLDVLNTWRCTIKYIYPMLILAWAMGIIGWLTFLILSLIFCFISIVIWIKIKIFHWRVSYIQILIDEIIYNETGIRLPNILMEE